jgi:hypothetical protein
MSILAVSLVGDEPGVLWKHCHSIKPLQNCAFTACFVEKLHTYVALNTLQAAGARV